MIIKIIKEFNEFSFTLQKLNVAHSMCAVSKAGRQGMLWHGER